MHALRLVLAFSAGAALYQVVVIVVGGILAARTVPHAYFSWFGRGDVNLALAGVQVACALPMAMLVAVGTLAVYRLLRASGPTVLHAVLAGLVVCFLYWVVASALAVAEGASAEHFSSPGARLRQVLLPPWWSVSTFIAPWVGFALAAWLVRNKREA